MAGTTLKLGWTDPMTGAFGPHPLLGPVLDLNDGQTFTLVSPEGLELAPARRTLVPTGNVRTQGERVTRAIYRHNREARVRLVMGPGASYTSFVATMRALASWLDAPPAVPFAVQWQPPSATAPVYLDVVGAAHAIPTNESQWLRLQFEPVEIVLIVRPGLRGDRVTLQNLVPNPGFEAGSGPGVVVFNDDFATLDAYTQVGGTSTLAANEVTIPAGGMLQFGTLAWSSVRKWQCRFQCNTSGAIQFVLHSASAGDFIDVYVGATALYLTQSIASTAYNVGTASYALTNGAWYWMQLSQMPSAPGTQCDLYVAIVADNAGAPTGSVIATAGPVPTQDSGTAFTGLSQIKAFTTSMVIGGGYPDVHTVSLFGPGGWMFTSRRNAATGVAMGAWKQDSANTYSGGPVTSFGAARIDLPPAGTIDCCWLLVGAGASAVSAGIPARLAGDFFGLSAQVRSNGLSSSAVLSLQVAEYDSGGVFLRSGTVASKTGDQATWTTLAGTYVTDANCAYLDVQLCLVDGTPGSAGGSVWFDNAQCWNISSTGQASMPYCELRFPQAPAQLLVSGLEGDLPAPAHLAFATYCANFARGDALAFALGRRAQASRNARLVGPSVGFYGTALSPQSTAYLDDGSYGGYYVQTTITNGWNPRAFSFVPEDQPGVYHLFSRFLTQQAVGNLGNVATRVVTQQRGLPWYGALDSSDVLGSYYGPWVYPISQSGVWTPADAGQVNVPSLPAGALTDPARNYLTPRPQWNDTTGGGSICRANWQTLVPVDGSLVVGVVGNAANAFYAVTGKWLWVYVDGLLVNRAGALDGPAATFSLEASALPDAAAGAGGPGSHGSGSLYVNLGADPYLTLDPTIAVRGGSQGVNQLAGYIADGQGNVLPLHAEIQYTPLYLWPR